MNRPAAIFAFIDAMTELRNLDREVAECCNHDKAFEIGQEAKEIQDLIAGTLESAYLRAARLRLRAREHKNAKGNK